MSSKTAWDLDRASRYHFRKWDDTIVLYLEGEGGTYLLNDFSASILKLLTKGKVTESQLLKWVAGEYPSESSEELTILLIETLSEFNRIGIVVRV